MFLKIKKRVQTIHFQIFKSLSKKKRIKNLILIQISSNKSKWCKMEKCKPLREKIEKFQIKKLNRQIKIILIFQLKVKINHKTYLGFKNLIYKNHQNKISLNKNKFLNK